MGCDGGSIPTRCELVKTKKKKERADPAEITRVKWFLCALSKEPLAPPIVACPTGQLFNKEAVITHLLQKTLPAAFSYIKSMKDLLELKWSENPAWGKIDGAARFACPVTGIEANGRHGGFSALRGCGCVLSERALREVPSPECLLCRRPFSSETDVLPLNPPPEVAEQLLREWKARQQSQQRKTKKGSSAKRREKAAAAADVSITASSSSSNDREESSGSGGEAKEGKGDVDEGMVREKERGSADGDDAAGEARKRKQPEKKGPAKDGEKKVAKKKSSGSREEGRTKRPRVAAPLPGVKVPDTADVVAKMGKSVYDSIFLPGGRRTKQPTFTHYG